MAEPVMKRVSYVILPGLLLVGFYDYFTNHEVNKCEMTYMFEMPDYIPISLHPNVEKKFPRYKLYAYGEGRYAETLRERKFYGTPVLFIPGNAGSFKQVRSLASVALRMSVGYSFHFNYFSVDLNEEYSALFGATLQDQTEFVSACVKRILKLYQTHKSSPCSVILVGHSMGGVIARALFTLPDFDATTVNVIFTQASPHKPIAFFDHHLKSFYDNINNHWIQHRNTSLSHVNFVSFGGGHRDVMVRSSLTSIEMEYPHVLDLQYLTSAIPNVWLSTDHNGIVWCKQLVINTQRSMFDLIDHQMRQLNIDPLKRANVLHYHFARKTSKLSYDAMSRLNTSVLINSVGLWSEQRKACWAYTQSKVTSLTYHAIPIRRDGNLIVIGRNVPFHDWIMVCKANTEIEGKQICEKASVISRTRLLPSGDGNTRVVHLRLSDWRANTHAVIQVQPTVNRVEIFSDIYDPDERHINFHVPYMPYNMLFTSLKLEKTTRNTVFYNITLGGFNTLWQAYKVKVTPLHKKCKNEFESVMRFYVPWSNEDIYTIINCSTGGQTVVKLQSTKPNVPHSDPQVHFFLDPQCQYRITVSAAFFDIMGQIIRHYFPQLFVLSTSLLIEILSAQLSSFLTDGICPDLADSLSPYRMLFTLVAPSYIILYISKVDDIVDIIDSFLHLSNLPIETQHLQLTGSLLLLLFCSLVLVQLISRVISIPVFLISKGTSYLYYKYLNQEPGKLSLRPRHPIGAAIGSAVLISCAYASCGSIILLFTFFAYLFKVSKLKGQLNTARNRGRDIKFLSLAANIHYTVMILWLFVWVTTIPCLMVWVRNIRIDIKLNPDYSFIPSAVLIASLMFCWAEEATQIPRWMAIAVVWLLRILSLSIVFFVLDTLFLLPLFVCFASMLVDALYAFRVTHEKCD